MAAKVDLNEDPDPKALSCMEVWGGNGTAETSFCMPGLDVWVSNRPKAKSLGDCGEVHFLSSCASGRITRMLLADVCGQRTVSHQLACQLRRLMMRNINAIGQSRFIRDMHSQLRSFSDRGGFATAIIGTFFAPRRAFTLCNAGHPAPVVFRAAAGHWSLLKACAGSAEEGEAAPLGVVNQGEYQQFRTQLEEGDMVLIYSNSLAECHDPRGHTLGMQGLAQQVAQIDPEKPAELVSTLLSRLRQWDPKAFIDNDATLLLCRATNRAVSLKNNLLAPFRIFGAVEDRTRLK